GVSMSRSLIPRGQGDLTAGSGAIESGSVSPHIPSALRERRLIQGWSQDALARRVGISRQALNALERGHARPSVETALALARLLGTTVEQLFAPSDAGHPPLPARPRPPGTRLRLPA